jgi:1,4-dihydroxy-2-naphthoyl-CoA hydrolase
MADDRLTAMPDGWRPAVPFDRCFDAQYGLEIVSDHIAGFVEGRVQADQRLLGTSGAVHGGVFAAIAEALASRGTALAVIPDGRMAVGLSNDTSVTGPVSAGALHASARVVARDDDLWVWTVETRDDAGRLCGLSRVTVAVRDLDVSPRPAGARRS